MDALQALGEPVRRDVVELLARADRTAGELARMIGAAHGISQPAVSRHLKVLRECGIVTSSVVGQQRLYALNPSGLEEVADWVQHVRAFWEQRIDALETELARGRAHRSTAAVPTDRRRAS